MKIKRTGMGRIASLLVAMALLTVSLAGCTASSGTYSLTNYTEDSGDGYWQMEYEYFDGFKQKRVNLAEAEHTVAVEIVCASGELTLIIEGASGKRYLEETYTGDAAFTLETYMEKGMRLRVEAEKSEGRFAIEWT